MNIYNYGTLNIEEERQGKGKGKVICESARKMQNQRCKAGRYILYFWNSVSSLALSLCFWNSNAKKH